MLLKICVSLVLVAFAQVALAQDVVDEFTAVDQINKFFGWDKRDGARSLRGRSLDETARGNRLTLLDKELSLNDDAESSDNVEGRTNHGIANYDRTNKIVPGIVEVAPTRQTKSKRVKVIRSTKRRNFEQNSASTVVQNNIVKSTNIHVHTNTVIHKPKLVTKVIRRHRTKFIINTQPIKTHINIERQQDVIQPEVKNIVVYQNSERVQRRRLPTIVRNRQQNQRLPTIREAARNGGTEVVGNPMNPGSVNLNADGENFNVLSLGILNNSGGVMLRDKSATLKRDRNSRKHYSVGKLDSYKQGKSVTDSEANQEKEEKASKSGLEERVDPEELAIELNKIIE